MTYTVKDILNMEVAPALGCTEPTAIALGAAAAASLLPSRDIEAVEIWVDPNIYKNGVAVSIPGASGATGLDLAAAMGAFGGDPVLRMEVLEPLEEGHFSRAKELVKAGRVKVNLLDSTKGIYIRSHVEAGGHAAESVIEDLHDNISALSLDGAEVSKSGLISSVNVGNRSLRDLEGWLKGLELTDLLSLLDDLDGDDREFLMEGVKYNVALANYGLKYGPGLGIGLGMKRLAIEGLLKRDMVHEAKALTSAAADARMSGAKLPAMSSGGSGNHGLTAILPIWALREFIELEGDDRVVEAIALSHLVTAYIKAFTGRLSAICGCSVAAGAGAAAGATYLLGGNHNHIAAAIINLLGDLAGVICDGAKASCSFKLATAAGSAVQAALFALHGIRIASTDGIIGLSPEGTMQNVGTLSSEGMIETDRTILQIMLDKRFAAALEE